MSVTVIESETETGGEVSTEREVGRLEAEVEHVEEKVEEVESQVEAVEEKLEAVEEKIEWNNQEKQSLWNELNQQRTEMSELKTTTSQILVMLQDEEEDDQADESALVEVDIEPILETEQPEPETKAKTNLLTKILFGR